MPSSSLWMYKFMVWTAHLSLNSLYLLVLVQNVQSLNTDAHILMKTTAVFECMGCDKQL